MSTGNENITRQDIDDVYKRNYASNSYKNRIFEGKRTARDEYTGEIIYYSEKSVKGVKRHYKTSSTANIDHVTPVDRLCDRYGDLSKEQIRQMANADYNLSNTNEALNKSKGAMTNHEYLKDKQRKGNPESFETTVRMLHKEAISEAGLAADSTRYRVKNKIEPVVEKVSERGTAAKQACYNFVGDTHVKGIDERIAQTPLNGVNWSGVRGKSDCYPADKKLRHRMKNKYGQDYVSYDKTGEPDFSPFSVVEVRIPNMGERADNFKNAKERILGTPFAKENNLKTKADIERYMKKHKLTLHEVSDGVTVQLVPTEINATFGHSGGVAEVSSISLNIQEDGLIRTGKKASAAAKIQVKKSGVLFTETIDKIPNQLPKTAIKLSNDFSEGALDAVSLNGAGIPILVEGAMNAVQIVSGEKDVKTAVIDVTKVTSAVALSGGTTRVITNIATDTLKNSGNKALQNIVNSNQVAQIIGISVMLKDAFFDYVNGDINGEEFLNQVNEKAIGLVASGVGMEVATLIVGTGGAALIPAVAAMVVSTVCVEIYKNIQNAKLRAELSEHEWNIKYHALEQLSREAVIELRQQKEQIENMMESQFKEWDESFNRGFLKIFDAIQNEENTSEAIADGLQDILEVFNKNVVFKTQKEFDDALMDKDFIFVL